ncbi:MAG: hypothetical protein ACKVPX_02030 [Myxococcaceae bacterium]
MRLSRVPRLFALACALFASATLGAPPAAAPESRPEATAQMRATLGAVSGLQPYLAKAEAFGDPKNAERIRAFLDTLSRTEHAFPKGVPQEPGLAIVLGQFGSYLRQAQTEFRRGEHPQARGRLQTVTSFCFACHTRLHLDKDFVDAGKQVDALMLPPLARADFLASTRQFEKALTLYGEVLAAATKDEAGYLDFQHALRRALTIWVRVKGDAPQTVKLLGTLAKRDDLPEFIRSDVDERLVAARAWEKDRFKAAQATPQQLIEKARTLTTSTRATSALFLTGRDEVFLLRASNLLHEALNKNPSTPLRADALYLLGASAAALDDPTLWDLDRLYFETCIRETAHTPAARRCFEAYRQRTVQGFTGSGGTRIPQDELTKLAELRGLAQSGR